MTQHWYVPVLAFVVLATPIIYGMWRRSRWTWLGTALAFLLLVSLLVAPNVTPSAEATHCGTWSRTAVQRNESVVGTLWGWIKLHACWSRQLVPCANDPCWGVVDWQNDYGEGSYDFKGWLTPTNAQGQYASGVKWKEKTIQGKFRGCIVQGGGPFCQSITLWITMVIRTDGTSVVDKGWYYT